MRFFLACDEKLRRPKTRRRSREFCYWLIWVCWWDWVVVVLNCFMGMFWDAISFYWLLRRCAPGNWVQISSPKNSYWGIRHNTTLHACATTKWRKLVTINKFKSWCLALVSFAAGFRVVTQSERCVMTLKTAVKETGLGLEYFCLQPFVFVFVWVFFDTLLGQECNHDRIYKKTYN